MKKCATLVLVSGESFVSHQMSLKQYLRCAALALSGALLGCSHRDASMTTEDIIRQHRNSPIGDSIDAISHSLAERQVLVGTEGLAPTEDGKLTGKIRLKTGLDNEGSCWAYVYTSQDEFSKAFPNRGPFAEMAFADVFTIIERDSQFGGINLNSASDSMYPIPREFFDRVKENLKR